MLIIDDNPCDLLWAQRILVQAGYRIVTAEDGRSGIDKARLLKPDVILLDCLLPDLDGIEVCRTLKAGDDTANIPVIFLSVLDDGFNMVQCYEFGAEYYLIKPVTARQLVSEVAYTLEERGH